MQNVKMSKLFRSRKGFEGIGLFIIILFIFIGTAFILPFVNSEFGTSSPDYDTDNVQDEFISEDLTDVSSVSAGDLLKSIGKIFFWTFGDLPLWLDLIFVVLRITFLVLIIKNFTPFL